VDIVPERLNKDPATASFFPNPAFNYSTAVDNSTIPYRNNCIVVADPSPKSCGIYNQENGRQVKRSGAQLALLASAVAVSGCELSTEGSTQHNEPR
jgi:hypothetical protein